MVDHLWLRKNYYSRLYLLLALLFLRCDHVLRHVKGRGLQPLLENRVHVQGGEERQERAELTEIDETIAICVSERPQVTISLDMINTKWRSKNKPEAPTSKKPGCTSIDVMDESLECSVLGVQVQTLQRLL